MSVDVHVLVPIKRLNGAKERLAALLSSEERAALVRAMLTDVVDGIRRASGVSRVTLVSSEPTAPDLARAHGVAWWDDRSLPWNAALEAAMREVVTEPCAVVIAADVPLLEPHEVEAFIRLTPARGIAIARAGDGGTNAVSLRPPAVAETWFGRPGSAQVHFDAARRLGLEGVIVDQPGTALDLDTPKDVERFMAIERDTHTRALLSRMVAMEVRA